MNKMLERMLAGEKIAVATPDKESWDGVMEFFEKNGIRWVSDHNATEVTREEATRAMHSFENHNNLAVRIYNGRLTSGEYNIDTPKGFITLKGYQTITLQELLGKSKITKTKNIGITTTKYEQSNEDCVVNTPFVEKALEEAKKVFNKEVFNGVLQGLKDAKDYLSGKKVKGVIVHKKYKYITTHEELLKLHGKKVTCRIEGHFVDDAKIYVADDEGEENVYICQNYTGYLWGCNQRKFGYRYTKSPSSKEYLYESDKESDFFCGITEIQLLLLEPKEETYTLEEFKTQNIAIHTPKKKGYKKLMKRLEKAGIRWSEFYRSIKTGKDVCWASYKGETCISFNEGLRTFFFGDCEYFQSKGYTIIKPHQLITEKPKTMTGLKVTVGASWDFTIENQQLLNHFYNEGIINIRIGYDRQSDLLTTIEATEEEDFEGKQKLLIIKRRDYDKSKRELL